MRSLALGLSIVSLSSVSLADPIAVYAPRQVSRETSSQPTNAVADAVSEVLSVDLRDVLSGVETATRVDALAPAANTCRSAQCAAQIAVALDARAVVLVDATQSRHRASVRLTVVNRNGETIASRTNSETVGSWADVIALARVSARELIAPLHALDRAEPTEAPRSQPVVTVTPPAVTEHLAPTPNGSQPRPLIRRYRRWPEALAGGAIFTAGAVLTSLALVSVARDGSVANDLGDGREEVYSVSTRDWVFLGVGAAALAGGVVLVIDGLQQRTEILTTPTHARRWQPSFDVRANGLSVGVTTIW